MLKTRLPTGQSPALMLALLCFLVSPSLCIRVAGKDVVKVILKSCQGWCLKKFVEAKAFIEQDLDHYDPEMVVLDYLGGGFPRLVLIDGWKKNIKTYDISKINRTRIRGVFKTLEIPIVKPLRPLDDPDLNKVRYGLFNGYRDWLKVYLGGDYLDRRESRRILFMICG